MGWRYSTWSMRDDPDIKPTLKNTYFSNQARKKWGTSTYTQTAALLPALKKMFTLFTSRFVIPPPRDMISCARSSRNRFWASDQGRSPTAKETQEELEHKAYEADRGMVACLSCDGDGEGGNSGDGNGDGNGDDNGNGNGDGNGDGDGGVGGGLWVTQSHSWCW